MSKQTAEDSCESRKAATLPGLRTICWVCLASVDPHRPPSSYLQNLGHWEPHHRMVACNLPRYLHTWIKIVLTQQKSRGSHRVFMDECYIIKWWKKYRSSSSSPFLYFKGILKAIGRSENKWRIRQYIEALQRNWRKIIVKRKCDYFSCIRLAKMFTCIFL